MEEKSENYYIPKSFKDVYDEVYMNNFNNFEKSSSLINKLYNFFESIMNNIGLFIIIFGLAILVIMFFNIIFSLNNSDIDIMNASVIIIMETIGRGFEWILLIFPTIYLVAQLYLRSYEKNIINIYEDKIIKPIFKKLFSNYEYSSILPTSEKVWENYRKFNGEWNFHGKYWHSIGGRYIIGNLSNNVICKAHHFSIYNSSRYFHSKRYEYDALFCEFPIQNKYIPHTQISVSENNLNNINDLFYIHCSENSVFLKYILNELASVCKSFYRNTEIEFKIVIDKSLVVFEFMVNDILKPNFNREMLSKDKLCLNFYELSLILNLCSDVNNLINN